ncbi:sensor histidine kinase [Kribbella sp. NPDC050124]|uniref:sensor histidine kinase n=1 Tax=Kribbella sp. NPDC050124 TaxID=3364114 RepID=UPI0037BBC0A3
MRSPSAAIALVAAVVLLPFTTVMAFQSLPLTSAWVVTALAAGTHAAVAWRRERPVLALALVALGVAGQAVCTGLFFLLPSTLVVLLVIYAAAAYGSRVMSLAVGLAGAGGTTIRYAIDPDVVRSGFGPVPWLLLILLVAVVGVAWTMGLLRRAQLDAAVLAAESAEFERRERERRAVADERARISRDLHDILAHSLTVIVGQSRVARFDPAKADTALEVIEDTARSSLSDLRATLRTLQETTDLQPQPMLTQVPGLLARVRGAGLDVNHTVEGTPRALGAATELALYRFVQEALTNAARHAAGAAVGYREHWQTDRVTMTFTNARRSAVAVPGVPGLGLVGMRERLAAVGGQLVVRTERTFTVTAEVPYHPKVSA